MNGSPNGRSLSIARLRIARIATVFSFAGGIAIAYLLGSYFGYAKGHQRGMLEENNMMVGAATHNLCFLRAATNSHEAVVRLIDQQERMLQRRLIEVAMITTPEKLLGSGIDMRPTDVAVQYRRIFPWVRDKAWGAADWSYSPSQERLAQEFLDALPRSRRPSDRDFCEFAERVEAGRRTTSNNPRPNRAERTEAEQ